MGTGQDLTKITLKPTLCSRRTALPSTPPRPTLRWFNHLTLELKCTVSVTQEALRTTKCISVHQRKIAWCSRQRVLCIMQDCLSLRTVASLGFTTPACAFLVPGSLTPRAKCHHCGHRGYNHMPSSPASSPLAARVNWVSTTPRVRLDGRGGQKCIGASAWPCRVGERRGPKSQQRTLD